MYGWRITKDFLDDTPTRPNTLAVGPQGMGNDILGRLLGGEGKKFRMLDGDGIVYFEGLFIGDENTDEFEPLDDYGTPDSGCTDIQYFENGKWETL